MADTQIADIQATTAAAGQPAVSTARSITGIVTSNKADKLKILDKLFSVLEILSIHKVKYNFTTATSLFECLPFTTTNQISKSLFSSRFSGYSKYSSGSFSFFSKYSSVSFSFSVSYF